MGMCEMCGVRGSLYRANVEGTMLSVCRKCAGFGRVVGREEKAVQAAKPKPVEKKPELLQVIVGGFGPIIRSARERRGLKQKEFARAIAEKESLVQKLESGSFEPSIQLARKIESFLKVKLVEQHEEKHEAGFRAAQPSLTIGDVLARK